MYQNKNDSSKLNPIKQANILSLITYLYTFDLFKRASKKDLEENDIYEVLDQFDATKLGDDFQKKWENEKELRKNPSLYKVLWTCYGKQYLLLGMAELTRTLLYAFLNPLALGKLVSYFTPNQTNISKQEAIYYAILLISLNIFTSLFFNYYLLKTYEYGLKARTAISSVIYRKCLKLSTSEILEFSNGNILTLINKDVNTLDNCFVFINAAWITIVQISIITYMLCNKIGYSTFAGIGFVILILLLQVCLSTKLSTVKIQAGEKTDNRIQITKETLSAIKIIKMYTWEKFFANKISNARKSEINKLKQSYYLKATTFCTGDICIKITLFILYMTYIGIGNNISAEIVFFSMSCINSARLNISVAFPTFIVSIGELRSGLHRIKKVLLSKELTQNKQTGPSEKTDPKIVFVNVTIKVKEKITLQDVNINLGKGIHLITGPIGSGKSSFLKAILNEFLTTEGKLNVNGRISYASGEPWIFPGTIRQNILFGEDYNITRYNKILEICALNYDLKKFVDGDETLICDQGINISTGQQARINFARAIYRETDIYLIDDCFSSLDSGVQDHIFQKCIKEFLKDKLILLVSHAIKYTEQVDTLIIVENKYVSTNNKPTVNYIKNSISQFTVTDSWQHKNENNAEKNAENDDKDTLDKEEMQTLLTKTNKSIYYETNKIGKVDKKMYWSYLNFGGGIFPFLILVVLIIATQGVDMYNYMLISRWVNIGESLSNVDPKNITSYTEIKTNYNNTIKLYAIFTALETLLFLLRPNLVISFCAKASRNIHKVIVDNSVYSCMEFFDTHLIGNILNRFSKDMNNLDESLPFILYECVKQIFAVIGILILIASANMMLLIPMAIIATITIIFSNIYIKCGRSLKRLESATRSPILGHLNATLRGLPTIRSHEKQDIVQREFDLHQNLHTSAYHMGLIALRAFALAMEMSNSLFIVLILGFFLVFENASLSGDVGLAITQAFMLTFLLEWTIQQWAFLETQMTSVERIMEYTEIKKEKQNGKTLKNWPHAGSVKYQNVTLSNNKKTDEPVLKNISFSVGSGEKLGLVGRTGSGKSSIISTLFRLYDIKGQIFIDDVDITTLSINFLRSKLAIIPQNPILFTGTIRNNIDPNQQFSDDEIWTAIKTVRLDNIITNLYKLTKESDYDFSSGEKQLLCLARALIQKNKIVILDEMTSCVDLETDKLIHDTIKTKFKDCTIFTIAHRLDSILNSDKVMVIENGRISEFGKPNDLLENNESIFCKMFKQYDTVNSYIKNNK